MAHWFGVSWHLALSSFWNCYCSLRTSSDLALVFGAFSLVSFCLQICWTEDASLTRNQFPCKANCVQIRLHHPCGVLMLNCGYVQSESSQFASYESSAWQTDSSGLAAQPGVLYLQKCFSIDMINTVTAFALMGKFAVAGAFAIVYNYTAELFPTPVR